MKKILGLDLGTASIGSAYVLEAEKSADQTKIVYLGTRIILSSADAENFSKGLSCSPTTDRTFKRSMRRRLQRYKQRRSSLIQQFKKIGIITNTEQIIREPISETHELLRIRSKAVSERVSLEEFARILLTINKRRGYKSNRKTSKSTEEDGKLVDAMAVTKELIKLKKTPGQYMFERFKRGKYAEIDFYPFDLINELKQIWEVQGQKYPDVLTEGLLSSLLKQKTGKAKELIYSKSDLNPAEVPIDYQKGKKLRKTILNKYFAYESRSLAVTNIIPVEQAITAIVAICKQINNSSGYLGAIGDRSRVLYANNQTIGQYLYERIKANPHDRIRGEVFYRQDYLDEFDRIWECQQNYYPAILTNDRKQYIRNRIIFYQRPLKSKKSELAFCEFESREVEHNGKKYTEGLHVAPKSSPVFQHFRLWQRLGQIEVSPLRKWDKQSNELFEQQNNADREGILNTEAKQKLFSYLNLLDHLTDNEILNILGYSPDKWKINFREIIGNRTNNLMMKAFFSMKEMTDGEQIDWEKNLTKITNGQSLISPEQIVDLIRQFFEREGITTSLLYFDPATDNFREQSHYSLWHLLYSYEDDNSPTGTTSLCKTLAKRYGIPHELCPLLASLTFERQYGSLSTKAMRKLLPFMQEKRYDEACKLAGYRHSAWITKEENAKRTLKNKLPLLRKGSLRNPVVEKILNQMTHVINTHIAEYGNPDEIRIEMARDMQANSKQRKAMTAAITEATKRNTQFIEEIQKEFGFNPSKNDLIKYKLWKELAPLGNKTLYSNIYIPKEELFTAKFEIEHIIPRALFYDDSFSNKTLELNSVNKLKGNKTALDYLDTLGQEKANDYILRVEELKKIGAITQAKYKKLLIREKDLGDDFTNRDLTNTRYIIRHAADMLLQVTPSIVHTNGSITAILRRDWGLLDILKELNLPTYESIDRKISDPEEKLTQSVDRKDGQAIKMIKDWSKRDDHRHHAMDALITALTTRKHVQYLNGNSGAEETDKAQKLEQLKALRKQLIGSDGHFIPPMHDIRVQAKEALSRVIISTKVKGKVTTPNTNIICSRDKTTGRKIYVRQTTLTPRGALHLDTKYGINRYYQEREVSIGSKLTQEEIRLVSSLHIQSILLERLRAFDNNPKSAFTGRNSVDKKPLEDKNKKLVYTDKKVKQTILANRFVKRDQVNSKLNLDKVIDTGIKRILEGRLQQYGGKYETAFSDLENNPIWLNEEKGIAIKSVRIRGKNNAIPIHQTDTCPIDYVANDNNHHLAVYVLPDGTIEDDIVTFFDAVERSRQGLPIVDKNKNQSLGWKFLFSIKQNEYFLLPQQAEKIDIDTGEISTQTTFSPKDLSSEYIMNPDNYAELASHIFRVQSISKTPQGNRDVRIYLFKQQYISGSQKDSLHLKGITYRQISSAKDLAELVKIRVNHLGRIVSVGEK